MLEEYAFFILIAGLLVGVVGWVWLVKVAFKVSKPWGFGVLLLPPLAVVFVPAHFRKSVAPLVVFLISGVLLGAPYAVNYYNEKFVDLGPREKIVNGELHITLTGWGGTDYSFLEKKRDTVVLQMANPNVTDETLNYLRGMDRLRELDLNDTQVTDEGLAVIAGLPRLEELRLARTKISDEGFRQHLGAKESLLKLDLTGRDVKGKTKRDWKQAKAGREYLD
jgi:Leucine Rich repeat